MCLISSPIAQLIMGRIFIRRQETWVDIPGQLIESEMSSFYTYKFSVTKVIGGCYTGLEKHVELLAGAPHVNITTSMTICPSSYVLCPLLLQFYNPSGYVTCESAYFRFSLAKRLQAKHSVAHFVTKYWNNVYPGMFYIILSKVGNKIFIIVPTLG